MATAPASQKGSYPRKCLWQQKQRGSDSLSYSDRTICKHHVLQSVPWGVTYCCCVTTCYWSKLYTVSQQCEGSDCMPLYGLQNTQHQKHPQPLNNLLIQFSLRHTLMGSIFFPSVTVHHSHFRHTCNCQQSWPTARWSNTERCFPTQPDWILSLGVSEPCTLRIKHELHSEIKSCPSAYTVNKCTEQECCDTCMDIHSATQQLPKITPVWKHHRLRRDQKKLFHSVIIKMAYAGWI